jgi:methyl-accepting chemotaxis protein
MRFLRKMRVASRLAIGFGVLAVAMIVVGAFGLARVSRVNGEMTRLADYRVANLNDVTEMLEFLHQNARQHVQAMVETDPAKLQALIEGQRKNVLLIGDHQKALGARLEKDPGDDDEEAGDDKQSFAELVAKTPAFLAANERLEGALASGERESLLRILAAEVIPAETDYTEALETVQNVQTEEVEESANEGTEVTGATRVWTFVLIIVALVIAMAVGFLITQSITGPLLVAVRDADKVAEGRFEMKSKDELGQVSEAFGFVHQVLNETVVLKNQVQRENMELQTNIMDLLTVVADASDGNLTVRAKVTAGALGNVADAFNSLLEALQTLMGRVAKQIDLTNRTVNHITASSSKMADGASSQANEVRAAKVLVDKTAEDIKRMGAAADSAAEAARHTESSASEGASAIEKIVTGMEQLRQNVQAGAKKMKNLGDRSMEITGIVETISRISEQTNMLALNAAIEAARAGEHGRGFSVVAEEVRKLAERAATATQEISRLVTAIHHETTETVAAIEKQTQVVEQESALVSRAGKSLLKIREVSSQSANLVSGISSLTKAQIEGSSVVGKAITQISLVAQATLQGVEGTVNTLSQLNKLSTELTQSISRFKVN